MYTRINIVAIELLKEMAGYESYQVQNAGEKIQYLAETIEKITLQLIEKYPNDIHIFVWRENGISNGNSRYLTVEDEEILKEFFGCLAQKYKSIVIIAGSISVKKAKATYKSPLFNKLKRQFGTPLMNEIMFRENEMALHMEHQIDVDSCYQVDLHYNNIIEAEKKYAADFKEVSTVRNTAYVFQGGEIFRHDKVAPFFEGQLDTGQCVDALFKPAKSKTSSPFITLMNPFSNKKISICVEICRENSVSYAKNLQHKSHFPQVDIQFLLSATVEPTLEGICGEFFLHVDSVNPVALVKLGDSPLNIQLIKVNDLKIEKICEPISAKYFIHGKIYDQINKVIKELPDSDLKHKILIGIQKKIRDSFALYHDNAGKMIVGELEKYKDIFTGKSESAQTMFDYYLQKFSEQPKVEWLEILFLQMNHVIVESENKILSASAAAKI